MAEHKSDYPYPRDRIFATLYGQASGDAIGLLTEFLPKREAKIYYGKYKNKLEYKHKKYCDDFHRSRWQEGDWTDDTDHMLLIMMALIDRQGQVDQVTFASRLKAWAKKGLPELGDTVGMGIGATTNKIIHHPKYPDKAADCAFEVWDCSGRDIAPNGAVMRTSILGIHQYWDTEVVARNAENICRTTHYDPRCRASTIAVSVAISLMLKREPKHLLGNGEYNVKQIIEDSYEMASRTLDTDEQKQMLRDYMEEEKIKKLELGERAKIGYTYKCMGAGFWALKQKNYRKALQKIVMQGGDADTNGAVAGALLGCKLGLSALPESWVKGLKHKDWLDGKIEEFLDLLAKMKRGEIPHRDTKESRPSTIDETQATTERTKVESSNNTQSCVMNSESENQT